MQSLDDLRLSIASLCGEFGSTSNIQLALAINIGLALVGVAVWYLSSGWVAFAGAVWAILNIIGPVKWVFGL